MSSPSVQEAKTATGNLVRQALAAPTEDTFATVENGQALRFQGGAIVVRPVRNFRQPSSVSWVVYGGIYALYKSLGDLADRNHQPFLGLPITDEAITPDGAAATTILTMARSIGL